MTRAVPGMTGNGKCEAGPAAVRTTAGALPPPPVPPSGLNATQLGPSAALRVPHWTGPVARATPRRPPKGFALRGRGSIGAVPEHLRSG